MEQKDQSKGVAATGIFAALAASSCCIPPVIAAIAGIGGVAGSLSWVEPLRPYLIIIAVVAIGYAWYSHFKSKKTDECGCDIKKPKFYQTKGYLIGITLFAALALTFPYYTHIFYPSNDKKEVVIVNALDVQTVTFDVEGMTCNGCASHVETEVNKLSGIVKVEASYEEATAKVEFDQTKVSLAQIEEAINGTGYKVVGKK